MDFIKYLLNRFRRTLQNVRFCDLIFTGHNSKIQFYIDIKQLKKTMFFLDQKCKTSNNIEIQILSFYLVLFKKRDKRKEKKLYVYEQV